MTDKTTDRAAQVRRRFEAKATMWLSTCAFNGRLISPR